MLGGRPASASLEIDIWFDEPFGRDVLSWQTVAPAGRSDQDEPDGSILDHTAHPRTATGVEM